MLLSRRHCTRVPHAGRVVLLIAFLVGEGGCGDSTGPADDESGDGFSSAVVVSDPQPLSFSAAAAGADVAAAANGAEQLVVYVSFPPGTVPGGETARISNRSGGLSLEAPVADGGLDPVPVAANAGDTLDVVVIGAGTELASALFIVPFRLPPVVIRTDPPKRKVDVPLNTIVMMVFSEPIDPTSLGGEIVLRYGAAVVSGIVQLLSDGTTAEFRPDGLLEPETTYALSINRGIRDLQGDTLTAQVDIEFTTGTSSAMNLAVNLPVDSPAVVVGAQLALRALDGATGSPVSNVAWSTSDPSAAAIDAAGMLTVVGTGLVTIQATSGGVSTSAVITAKTIQFDSIFARNHTCGITADGEAFCWGTNVHGELGTDLPLSASFATAPTRVAGGLRFRTLALGGLHTCGITTEGETYCWGSNKWGELGVGTISTAQFCGGVPCRPVPAPVVGIPELQEVRLGGWGGVDAEEWGLESSCGIALDGTAYCWGNNNFGQLGNGSIDSITGQSRHATPELVVASEPYQTIALSAWAPWTCGLTASGQVQCWGAREWHMEPPLAITVTETSGTPVAIEGTWTGLAMGGMAVCVRDAESAIHCWGYNRWATVADPPSDEFIAVPQPIEWSAGAPATSLALGVGSACGLTSDGEAWCWGSNDEGILGTSETLQTCQDFNGDVIPCTNTPVRGGWGLNFLAFTMGDTHACGIASDGIAYCWGLNAMGEVGDGIAGGVTRGLTRVLGQP